LPKNLHGFSRSPYAVKLASGEAAFGGDLPALSLHIDLMGNEIRTPPPFLAVWKKPSRTSVADIEWGRSAEP